MPTRKLNQSIQVGDEQIFGTKTITAGAAVSIDETVLDATDTSPAIPLTIDVSELEAIFVVADCDEDVTLIFTGPTDNISFTIQPGVPFCWFNGSGITNPFTILGEDVTEFQIDKQTSAGDARVRLELIYDPTP